MKTPYVGVNKRIDSGRNAMQQLAFVRALYFPAIGVVGNYSVFLIAAQFGMTVSQAILIAEDSEFSSNDVDGPYSMLA